MKKALYIVVAIIILAIVGAILAIDMTIKAPGRSTDIGTEIPIPVTDSKQTIRVTSPTSGQVVTSPLIVSGEARGSWYFEAVFPIELLDKDGNVIARAQAHAESDWTTTDFVPFSATLTFEQPQNASEQSAHGTLVLKRDNPSGLSQNDASVTVPINFSLFVR